VKGVRRSFCIALEGAWPILRLSGGVGEAEAEAFESRLAFLSTIGLNTAFRPSRPLNRHERPVKPNLLHHPEICTHRFLRRAKNTAKQGGCAEGVGIVTRPLCPKISACWASC